MAGNDAVKLGGKDGRELLDAELLVLDDVVGEPRVEDTARAERVAATEQTDPVRQAASAGVLLRRGEVEEQVGLEERAGGVVDRSQLVVDVRRDIDEGDLGYESV